MLPVGESLVVYDPKVARALKSIPQAIVLQRIVWSINQHASSKEKYEERFFKEDKWWMYDNFDAFAEYSGLSYKQVKCAIKALKDAEIIFIEKLDKKYRDHTNYYSINLSAYAALGGYEMSSSMSTKGTDRSVQNVPVDEYKRDSSMSTKGTHLPSKSLPDCLSENLTKKKGEERPPLSGSLEPLLGNQEGGNQEALKKDVSLEPVKAPPERLKVLYAQWEGRAKRLARMSPWEPSKEITALEKMAEAYLHSELNEILDHLEGTNSKIAREFIRPSDFQRSYFGTPMIDAAYAEIKTLTQSKNIKRTARQSEALKRWLQGA